MSKKTRAKAATIDSSRMRPWILVGLAVLAIGLYFNTLGHGLVFDDVTLILQNSQVTDLDWSGILFRGGYRPVRTATYALNYALGGTDPFGYHLFNVLLHALNAGWVFLLLWQLTRSNLGAGLGALWFAVHPVQTAAVAYVSGRKDLLAAGFLLLGFVCFLRFRERSGDAASPPAGVWAVLSGIAFLLAVLSKEVAIVFPALLLLLDTNRDWCLRRDEGEPAPWIWEAVWRTLRRWPLLYGGVTLVALGALYWAVFINQASRAKGYWGGTLETNLGTSFQLFVHYLKLVVVPYPLIADYTGKVLALSTGLASPFTLLSLGVFLLWLLGGIGLFRKSALVGLGVFWFFLTLAPVLQFIPFHELAADHFLYVPMVGIALLVAVTVRWLGTEIGAKPVIAGALIVCALFSVLAFVRNRDWRDKKTLWEATYATAPGSYRANANLGQIYFNEGRFDEGVQFTRRCFELDPKRALPHANLGAMYYSMGQQLRKAGKLPEAMRVLELASAELGVATQLDPKEPFAYGNWGSVHKDMALLYEAEGNAQAAGRARNRAYALYRQALSIRDPRATVRAIWLNYGNTYTDAGEYGRAVGCLTHYVKAFPEDPAGQYWMGFSLYQIGDYEKALPYLERAASASGTSDVWELVARTFETLGQNQGAIGAFLHVVQLDPESAGARLNLGILYQRIGRLDLSIRYLREALELDHSGQYSTTIDKLLRSMSASN